jgi:exodeoxyribonuclease VII small subunit
MSKKAQIADLESSLKEINDLIEKMEQSDLTLEQSLNHFEKGITLIKNCQTILRAAEQKVQILIQNSNSTDEASEELKPYASEDNSE